MSSIILDAKYITQRLEPLTGRVVPFSKIKEAANRGGLFHVGNPNKSYRRAFQFRELAALARLALPHPHHPNPHRGLAQGLLPFQLRSLSER